MICNRCHYDNAPSASSCARCGAPLSGSDDTQVFRRADLRRARQAEAERQSGADGASPAQTASPYARPQSTPKSPYARPQSAPESPYARPQSAPESPYARPQAAPESPYARPQSAPADGQLRRNPQAAQGEGTSADNQSAVRTRPAGAQARGARPRPSAPVPRPDASQSARAAAPESGAARSPERRPAAQPPIVGQDAPQMHNAQAQDEGEHRVPMPADARERRPQQDDYARRRPDPVFDPDEIEDDEVEERDFRRASSKPHSNTMMMAGIGILSFMALILLVICFLTFTPAGQRWKANMGLNAPAAAYWQLGDEALAAGDTESAVERYESALSRDSANYEGALKLAQTLKSAGNAERAERAYRLAISLRPTETAPYDSVIELMKSRGASEGEMVEMLRLAYQNTGNQGYNDMLLTYGPSAVRFDPEEGEYESAIKLQMASDEGATIYYTTDGSQPTVYSNKYVLPIELGEGVFTVRAFAFQNDLYSGETHKTYTIKFPTVAAPQFTSKPGRYSANDDGRKVIKISAPEGCKVYYTTDGSAPNADSTLYEDGISLRPGTYKLRMVARNADGVYSAETSAEYVILGELAAPFSDDDSFKSFYVDVTDQKAVNKQFKKLLETTGDTSTFFTQHYSFGEVDFTVKNGTPVVTAVRINNNDITGVRGTKVGWDAEDIIDEFRDEKHEIKDGERELYTLDGGSYGWIEYDGDRMTSINYMYVRGGNQLVELHYTIEDGEVSFMEYCISDM